MNINRQRPTPLSVPRTRRNHMIASLSSMPAGKCVPIAAIPMLREDAFSARISIAVEMLETKELLLNPVNLRVTAYVVPWLAFDRFQGSRDQFDRSYMGQPQVEGGAVVPFFATHPMGAHGSNAVYKALGMHAKPADNVNTAYLEAYNKIWNFRVTNRSKEIAERPYLTTTLAPAFWPTGRFEHVVPDFDQAVIDGEVALNLVNPRIDIRGLGVFDDGGRGTNVNAIEYDGAKVYPKAWRVEGNGGGASGAGEAKLAVRAQVDQSYPDIFGELQQNGITVSLSNIEMAKKTQAFAKLREQFEGHDDDWIIDMLMSGLSIPDQALKQPILLADKLTRFSQVKRYATDAGNLAESAVSGAAKVDLSLRVPRLSVGGVVMVIAEAMPEQLFERQRDPLFFTSNPDALPEYIRDTLDPEKVDVVVNGEVDTDHGTPALTFGYAPMNWKWNAAGPRIGGKFYRPSTNTSVDEARQRLWAIENVDPKLSEDFYLVKDIHTKPFLDTAVDPFEVAASGNAVLEGNTVFGGRLVEATSNYDAVAEKAPVERIEKE